MSNNNIKLTEFRFRWSYNIKLNHLNKKACIFKNNINNLINNGFNVIYTTNT